MIWKHLASYGHSVRGIAHALRSEPAMCVHFGATLAVVTLNVLLRVNRTEWMITLILIGLVWSAELFNTAIERLADRVTRERDVLIGIAKDLASGAVGILCIVAVVCALIIYLPYLI